MMTPDNPRWAQLPQDVRETLRRSVQDVSELVGPDLKTILLYGSAAREEFLPGRSNLNILLVLAIVDASVLTNLAKGHHRWKKEGVVVPLLLTEEGFDAWMTLFPLECHELSQSRLVLKGRDPFGQVRADTRNLAIQCLQEIRGNLLRVRQRFVEAGGTSEAIGVLLPLSITSLLPGLRGLLALFGRPASGSAEALVQECATMLEVDGEPLLDAWRLKTGLISPGKFEVPRLFERYLHALATLADRAFHAAGEKSLL